MYDYASCLGIFKCKSANRISDVLLSKSKRTFKKYRKSSTANVELIDGTAGGFSIRPVQLASVTCIRGTANFPRANERGWKLLAGIEPPLSAIGAPVRTEERSWPATALNSIPFLINFLFEKKKKGKPTTTRKNHRSQMEFALTRSAHRYKKKTKTSKK